jgi:cystathionine gamma-synthase
VAARTYQGATPGALEAFLALRGLRTRPLRFEASQASARELVTRLRAHPAIADVRYPGSGAMVSFIVRGGADPADAVCAAVQLIVPATSLGGVESSMERRQKYAGEAHVDPGLVRMSVGIEDVDDIWADLSQALAGALAPPSG